VIGAYLAAAGSDQVRQGTATYRQEPILLPRSSVRPACRNCVGGRYFLDERRMGAACGADNQSRVRGELVTQPLNARELG
jgi:hypothetical protein